MTTEMEKSIFQLHKEDFREPNDSWADLLKHYDLPVDTEYINCLLLTNIENKEIAEQITSIIKQKDTQK